MCIGSVIVTRSEIFSRATITQLNNNSHNYDTKSKFHCEIVTIHLSLFDERILRSNEVVYIVYIYIVSREYFEKQCSETQLISKRMKTLKRRAPRVDSVYTRPSHAINKILCFTVFHFGRYSKRSRAK